MSSPHDDIVFTGKLFFTPLPCYPFDTVPVNFSPVYLRSVYYSHFFSHIIAHCSTGSLDGPFGQAGTVPATAVKSTRPGGDQGTTPAGRGYLHYILGAPNGSMAPGRVSHARHEATRPHRRSSVLGSEWKVRGVQHARLTDRPCTRR